MARGPAPGNQACNRTYVTALGDKILNAEHLLHPLDLFYPGDSELPGVEKVEPGDIPEPYRSLLVHTNDMTPTLEVYHDGPIHVRALAIKDEGGLYAREVLLVRNTDGKVVEYGAIRIHLAEVPEATVAAIREAHIPLGHLLKEQERRMEHPEYYVEVTPDVHMTEHLDATGDQPLYGRRNTIRTENNQLLAEVMEILPVLS